MAGEVESWSRDAATGRLESTICGVPLTVDLRGRDSRIVVTLDNATEAPLSLRMGAQATARRGAIGEWLQRPLRPDGAAAGEDYLPCRAMEWVEVGPGRRAVFYVDEPVERAPSYGQYFVFDVEVRSRGGQIERRSLPLIAVHRAAGARRR